MGPDPKHKKIDMTSLAHQITTTQIQEISPPI